MPRQPRIRLAGYATHVIQRGNNRTLCFTSDADITAYAKCLEHAATKYDAQIHGWVFMTNHVHQLLTPATQWGISKMMQHIGRTYVRSFNDKYGRTGTLFEGRFRSSVVQEDRYVLACLQYIELNPVRAGMCRDPSEYKWSSYSAHAFGRPIRMRTPHNTYLNLANTKQERAQSYRALIKANLNAGVIADIRRCTQLGLVLGTEKFKAQFTHLTGDPT